MSRYTPEEKLGVWVVRDLRDPYRTLVTDRVTERLLTFPDEPTALVWIQREHDRDEQMRKRRELRGTTS